MGPFPHVKFHSLKATLIMSVAIFALFTVLMLLRDPTLAFGLSIGADGVLVVFGVLFGSLLLAGASWHYLLGGERWTVSKCWLSAMLMAVSGIFIDYQVIIALDKDWDIGQKLVVSKIEYFCLENFNRERCVEQVNFCPKCALTIEKWKRQKMSDRLKAYRAHYNRNRSNRRLPANSVTGKARR